MLLEISQNSQEDTCGGVSFLHPFIKMESLTQVFFCVFSKHLSKNTIFYRTPEVAASVKAGNFTNITTNIIFVDFLKIFGMFFWCATRIFWKITKLLVKKRFAKNPSADSCFVKTIILLTVMITTMLCVSW